MKILAVTDIHGANQKVMEMLKKETPDLLIIGGDLTTYGSLQDAQSAVRMFGSSGITMLCIAGNMDAKDHDAYYKEIGVSINGEGKITGDIGIFGVSAAPHSPLRTPYEISEDEITSVIQAGYKDVEETRLKVLVSHAPPYGTAVDMIRSGKHVGSTAVRRFIDTVQPEGVICGHIHEGRGMDKIGISTIVNCGEGFRGNYAIISVKEGKLAIQNKSL